MAGEAALELFAQGAAGAENQGRDGADRDVEDLGDLGVRASFELAHDERGALVETEEAEGAADLGRGRDVGVVGGGGGQRLVEGDLLRAARGIAEALPAGVVRDLDQPVVGALRALAPLEGAVGAEEGRLRNVFGVGLVVEDGERVAVDGVDVLLVEAFERTVSAGSLREYGAHCWLDPLCCDFLRFGWATALERATWAGGYRPLFSSCRFGAVLSLWRTIFRGTLGARLSGGKPAPHPGWGGWATSTESALSICGRVRSQACLLFARQPGAADRLQPRGQHSVRNPRLDVRPGGDGGGPDNRLRPGLGRADADGLHECRQGPASRRRRVARRRQADVLRRRRLGLADDPRGPGRVRRHRAPPDELTRPGCGALRPRLADRGRSRRLAALTSRARDPRSWRRRGASAGCGSRGRGRPARL